MMMTNVTSTINCFLEQVVSHLLIDICIYRIFKLGFTLFVFNATCQLHIDWESRHLNIKFVKFFEIYEEKH